MQKIPSHIQVIYPVLQQFQNKLIKLYPFDLWEIILFGSYARGNFGESSDVDMLLLFSEDINVHRETKNVMAIAYDFLLEDDCFLMPILTSKNLFYNTQNPLYQNIKKEGIQLWTKSKS